MRRRLNVLSMLAVLLAPSAPAAAAGFGLFQHGGRATGQAGAMTARAEEPSAIFYNPAALTALPGLQLQAGLDFSNATDEYSSTSGSFKAEHVITFPPALYLTWKGEGPVALGLGLDSPFFIENDWDPALFPGRFLTRRFELTTFELHPVIAWQVSESLSVGGGLRYLQGDLEQEDNFNTSFFTPGGQVPVEMERRANSDVDALAWDLAVRWADPAWGWGAVFRSNAELEGDGDASYAARDVPVEGLEDDIAARFRDGSVSQSFELPWELRGGFWFAPYPELRIELDAAYQGWSGLDDTSITFRPDPSGEGPAVVTPRDWEDTLSLRLGLEGDVTDTFMLYGGIGWEPSPVPGDTIEPGFPRGDALVYALGATYELPRISFDLGYSFHDHDDRGASGQEPLDPDVDGTYGSREQVWGFSARWRW